MNRGPFQFAAVVGMTGLLLASPLLAGRPGERSRKTAALPSKLRSESQSAEELKPFVAPGEVRQVVGKQPGKRKIDANRSLSLLPKILQGSSSAKPTPAPSNNSSNSSSSRRTSSSASRRASNSSGGLLNELFGQSKRNTETVRPTNVDRGPVDWEGVPYHQAKSSTQSSRNAPIRDPKPGETRFADAGKSRIVTGPTPAVGPTPAAVPKPPALSAVPSSRRTTPAKVVSSRVDRGDAPQLSALSSSRRSGRREIPSLDASEIAAAKTTKVSEDELVPRVSRRRLTPAPKPAEPKVASKPKSEPVTESLAHQSESVETPSAEIASKSGSSEPASPEAATKPDTPAVAETESPAELPIPAETPAPEAVVDAGSKPAPMSTAPSSPVAESPSAPATDNFAASRSQLLPPVPSPPPVAAPQLAPPAPSRPSFGTPGTVAGYHSGPAADAYQFQSRPTATTIPSPIVGSGISSPQPAPAATIAANPKPAPMKLNPRPAAPQAATPPLPPPITDLSPPAYRPPATVIAPPTVTTPPVQSPAIARPAPARAFSNAPFATTPAPAPVTPKSEAIQQLAPDQRAVASELPGIRVVTYGPASVMIRQTHEFEIRVENRGSIDAAGVMVRANVPNWAEVQGQNASRGEIENQSEEDSDRLIWTIDSLPAGKSEKMFVRLKAERSGTHGLDVDWTLIPQKSVATIEVQEPKLDLLIEGPEQVVYGESQTYKVRVLNPGDGIAPNVVFTLSPESKTPQTQTIGDIPSGKEAQFEVELTAQDLGDLKIHGLASGDLGLKAEAKKTILVSAAELAAVLTGPETKYQNTDARYLLEINNNGTATTKNVVAALELPSGVKYLGGIEAAQVRGSKVVWQIESLPPGAKRQYEFQCAMNSPGAQTLRFAAEGTAAGKTSVALATKVESIADLVMTIQDPAAPAPVGTEVVYEILIRNRGSREATSVRAIAQFSHGIEPRRVEGQTGQILTGQVLFDPIASIPAGGEVRVKVIAEAESPGHHRFRTEIRSGDTVLVAEEATRYMSKQTDRVSSRSESSVLR